MVELTRIVVYPKDVQRITGKSERYGRKVLNKIKTKYGKQKHQLVSLAELCAHLGLNEVEVSKYLDR